MKDEVRLRATKAFHGFSVRREGEQSYRTRRLQAGDLFYAVPTVAALVAKIKLAEEEREPGRVPAPPAGLVQKAAEVTPPAPEPEPEPAKAEEDDEAKPVAAMSTARTRTTRRRSSRKTAAKKG